MIRGRGINTASNHRQTACDMHFYVNRQNDVLGDN